jgi:hypothetical protein
VRILKHALNRCLWIVFAGTLKVVLLMYILFLPETAVANAAPEKEVNGGDSARDRTAAGNVRLPLLRLAAVPPAARLRQVKAEPMESN